MGSGASTIKEFNDDEKLYLKYNKIVDNSLWLFLVFKNFKTGCILNYNLEYFNDISGFEKIISNRNLYYIRLEDLDDKKKIKSIRYIVSHNTIDSRHLETQDIQKYFSYMNYLLGEDVYVSDFDKKKDICILYYHLVNNQKEKIFFTQVKRKQFTVNAITESADYRKGLEQVVCENMPNLFNKFEVKIDFKSN